MRSGATRLRHSGVRMSSLSKQILFHVLTYVIPVAFMFGMAAGKARESAAYDKLIDRMPRECRSVLGD
jgi:hypothetical protein